MTVPVNDPVLIGEVAYAMAKTNNPKFYPAVREYVRNVWGDVARSSEFDEMLRMRFDSSKNKRQYESKKNQRIWVIVFHFSPFDIGYRMKTIRQYLFGYHQDPSIAREFILDRDLPPYLRLFILKEINYLSRDFEPLLKVAQEELTILRREYGDNPIIEMVAEFTAETFKRMAKMLRDREMGIEERVKFM